MYYYYYYDFIGKCVNAYSEHNNAFVNASLPAPDLT